MERRAVVVRFARDGERNGVPLSRDTAYQLSVDGGAYEPFRAPWAEDELDQVITILRNESDERANLEKLAELGALIGESLGACTSFVDAVRADEGALTVYWHLDYPELARIPWEITSWWQPPHHHVLLTPGISFVRTVPLFDPGVHVGWPTGRNSALKLLFAWGEADGSVPHDEHLEALETACEHGGVEFRSAEVGSATELNDLYEEEKSDFVHVLAHGAMASNGQWGLALSKEVSLGAQVARALRSDRTTPALVTLAACDSGNETDNRFGSVAYELHAEGLPMVLASQFRLRKSVSNLSVGRVYDGLLVGDHPLEVLAGLRRQLSSADTEAWANEVLYTRYSIDELDRSATVARQQGALRRARSLVARLEDTPDDPEAQDRAREALRQEITKLEPLASLEVGVSETQGLLGGMESRIAYIGAAEDGPDEEALRDARDHYERGLRADLNNYYCGVNALHLSWLIGDRAKAAELQVIVDWATSAAIAGPDPDFWAHASAGEVKIYAGDTDAAVEHYRAFVRGGRSVNDPSAQRHALTAARVQLERLVEGIDRMASDATSESVSAAARASIAVLDSALARR